MTRPVQITLTVNGDELTASVDPRTTLADFLRDVLRLTGTHLGCEHGVCGACTIQMDGRSVRSCLLLAVQARGAELLTIEGMADGDELHPIQRAFSVKHGLQCGFCTPGFILATDELLAREPKPDEDAVKAHLSGNLCRCTGYRKVLDSVRYASELMAADADGSQLDHRSGEPA